MKMTGILQEAIQSQRPDFEDILNANKEKLQKSRTIFGVTKTLRSLFPDVKFKIFGGKGRAHYEPKTREIVIQNDNKMMSANTVRNDWDSFFNNMTELLTHEHIHAEQAKRRDYRLAPEQPEPLKKDKDMFHQRMMDLTFLHMDYERAGQKDKANEVEQKIKSLRSKAGRKNVQLAKTRKSYLSHRDEITAYAETIAHNLVTKYSDAEPNEAKQLALRDLKNGGIENINKDLDQYRSNFDMNDKTLRQLYKEVARYIQTK